MPHSISLVKKSKCKVKDRNKNKLNNMGTTCSSLANGKSKIAVPIPKSKPETVQLQALPESSSRTTTEHLPTNSQTASTLTIRNEEREHDIASVSNEYQLSLVCGSSQQLRTADAENMVTNLAELNSYTACHTGDQTKPKLEVDTPNFGMFGGRETLLENGCTKLMLKGCTFNGTMALRPAQLHMKRKRSAEYRKTNETFMTLYRDCSPPHIFTVVGQLPCYSTFEFVVDTGIILKGLGGLIPWQTCSLLLLQLKNACSTIDLPMHTTIYVRADICQGLRLIFDGSNAADQNTIVQMFGAIASATISICDPTSLSPQTRHKVLSFVSKCVESDNYVSVEERNTIDLESWRLPYSPEDHLYIHVAKMKDTTSTGCISPDFQTSSRGINNEISNFAIIETDLLPKHSSSPRASFAENKNNRAFQVGSFTITESGVPLGGENEGDSISPGELVELRPLGRGACATVFQGIHVPTLRLVALKVILAESEEKRRQIEKELLAFAQVLSKKKDMRTANSMNTPNANCVNDRITVPETADVNGLAGAQGQLKLPEQVQSQVTEQEKEEQQQQQQQQQKQQHQHTQLNKTKAYTETQSPSFCSSTQDEKLDEYFVAPYCAFASKARGTVTLVLEYMDSGTLQDLIKRGGCANENMLCKMSFNVLKGLSILHAKGVIHRDIKPANILINHFGFCKISDFGIAMLVENEVQTSSKPAETPGSFVGTMSYMSPERIKSQSYSYASDIWSFGLTILACANGQQPETAQRTYWDLLELLAHENRIGLPHDTHSSEFCDFVAMCLAIDPAKRGTAEELLTHPFVIKYLSSIDEVTLKDVQPVVISSLGRVEGRVLDGCCGCKVEEQEQQEQQEEQEQHQQQQQAKRNKLRQSTREASEVAEAVVRYLKRADSKHVVTHGVGQLSPSMAARKLVSEYRFRREFRTAQSSELQSSSESIYDPAVKRSSNTRLSRWFTAPKARTSLRGIRRGRMTPPGTPRGLSVLTRYNSCETDEEEFEQGEEDVEEEEEEEEEEQQKDTQHEVDEGSKALSSQDSIIQKLSPLHIKTFRSYEGLPSNHELTINMPVTTKRIRSHPEKLIVNLKLSEEDESNSYIKSRGNHIPETSGPGEDANSNGYISVDTSLVRKRSFSSVSRAQIVLPRDNLYNLAAQLDLPPEVVESVFNDTAARMHSSIAFHDETAKSFDDTQREILDLLEISDENNENLWAEQKNELARYAFIFLGGSCGETDWRNSFMTVLKECGVHYFNPQVDAYVYDIHAPMEKRAKSTCQALCYVIDARTRASGAMVEAAAALGSGRETIFAIAYPDSEMNINGAQITPSDLAQVLNARLALLHLIWSAPNVELLQFETAQPIQYLISKGSTNQSARQSSKLTASTYPTYDIFIGGPIKGDGSGLDLSRVVSAAKALRACTVATVQDESWENVNEYLDNAVDFERESRVLVYVVPYDARAYAVLVHASAYTSAGRSVIMIMSNAVDGDAVPGLTDERERTDIERARKFLLQEISALKDRAHVHVYTCEQIEKAVHHAQCIAVNMRTMSDKNTPSPRSRLTSPRGLGNAVRSLSSYSKTILKRQSVNRPAASSPSVSSVVKYVQDVSLGRRGSAREGPLGDALENIGQPTRMSSEQIGMDEFTAMTQHMNDRNKVQTTQCRMM